MKFLSLTQLFGQRDSRFHSAQKRHGRKPGQKRRRQSLPLNLETLEDRTVMTVVAAPVVDNHSALGVQATSGTGGTTAPMTVVDPVDPTKVVTVYVDNGLSNPSNQPITVRGSFSRDGGNTWSNFSMPSNMFDPTIAPPTPPALLPQATDATVAWDRSNNFYVVYSEHKPDTSAGYLVMQRFSFAGNTPSQTLFNSIIYAWDGADQVFHPYVAVDSTFPTDPDTGVVNKNAGNVYVTWATTDTPFANAVNFNANSVKELVSSNLGATFGPYNYLNPNTFHGGPGTAAVTLPSIAISQGNQAKGIAPGQVSTVYDDFNTFATANPPADNIDVALMKNATFGQGYSTTLMNPPSTPVAIKDAIAGTSPAPDTPQSTLIPLTVSIPASASAITLSTLTVGLDMIHPNLNELRIELYLPGMNTNNPGLVLLVNGTNPDGSTTMGLGISGANMGIAASGDLLSTYFDSNAPRSIQDTTAAATFLGHFRPEGGSLIPGPGNPILKQFPLSNLNGTWTLKITDNKSESGAGATPPVQTLLDWKLNVGGGWSTSQVTVSNTPIIGALNAPYPLKTTASPTYGIGPQPVIAADGTLGTSVTKGNLYVAFVSRLPTAGTQNQADNTDIVLFVSSNGGTSWSPGPALVDGLPIVNNDYTDNDGFSEAFANPLVGYIQGRTQFAPELTVDQSTGAVVATWFDGRYDSARSRVSRFVGVSQDGGKTFSQTFLNTPGTVTNPVTGASSFGTAYNVITGQVVSLEPIPENFSAGNSAADATFSYGDQQGIAAVNGNIIATWTGNLNGGNSAATNIQRNEIVTAHATYQAGPSIILDDANGNALTTMGPVVPKTAQLLSNGTAVSFNSTTTADGTPVFDGFVVYFDRPVNPNSFSLSAVSVLYRDVNTSGLLPGTPVTVTGVTPLFDENSTLAIGQQRTFGASKFLISVAAQSKIGTYSYTIAPVIQDNIEHLDPNNPQSLVSGNFMDQNADGTGGETPNDFFAVPSPVNPAQNFTGTFFTPAYTTDTLPIQITGPHMIASAVAGQNASPDNLVLNKSTSSLDVIFDRDMDPTTFTPSQIISLVGPVGAIGPNGAVKATFSITPNPNGTDPNPAHPRTFRINFLNAAGTAPQPLNVNGTYSLVLGSGITDAEGNALDQNQNAGVATLRDIPVAGTTTLTYGSTGGGQSIGSTTSAGVVTDSTITVPDLFLVQKVTVTVNITYPRDPDLTISLIAPNGVRVKLVSNLGSTGNQSNFTNTVFDDTASTAISAGGPPFTGRFTPQEPLADLFASGQFSAAGNWTLEIVTSNSGKLGTLNNWQLQLTEPLLSSGLGEPIADQATASFRIFTTDVTNPQSSSSWLFVGPEANTNSTTGLTDSGPIGAIAVDNSDPSGNTVYVAGSSGGVWKTTNFLTTSTQGPTYLPLTDFGPNLSLNVGSLAVFSRNSNPNQSIVFAGTGNPLPTPMATNLGVGFLRSMDGGKTWTLLDSTNNVDVNGNILPLTSPQRDHVFSSLTINKVIVDPRPTPNGNVLVYAAVTDPSGNNDGVWRSLDSGNTWTKMIAGQATDIVLDPSSGRVNVISNPTGNLDILYAALQGQGVFISPNRGQVWNQMLGQGGNPQVKDGTSATSTPVPVSAPASTPNSLPQGRIVLAKPSLTGVFLPDGTYTGNQAQDVQYAGWLYVAIASPSGGLQGLYVTKNFGLSWTKIRIPEVAPVFTDDLVIPSNNTALADVDPTKTSTIEPGKSAYDLTLAVNTNDPAVIYLGGLINLRIDTTGLYDAGAFYLSNTQADNGALRVSTTSPITLKNWPNGPSTFDNPVNGDGQVINLFRDPQDVFNSNTSAFESNIGNVTNSGGGVTWTQFNAGSADLFDFGTDQLDSYLQVITVRDPVTGLTRLIFGKDNGVFTAVDENGTVDAGIGSSKLPDLSRNGNLGLYQIFYSASQPSDIAAQAANALFYASSWKNGFLQSDPDVLNNGNTKWSGTIGTGGGVATDQTDTLFDGTQGSTVYRFKDPYAGSLPSPTDFLTTASDTGPDISHTFGLIQTSGGGLVPDTQWPYQTGFNFAVNPIDGDQIDIVSNAGRVFATTDRGTTWQVIGDPQFLDGAASQAMAFGAPPTNNPTGNLNNFVYVGTNAGHIFVTFTGGGGQGNQWFNISQNLDGSEIKSIITDPSRGSLDAYAVTDKGVYFMPNVQQAANNPTDPNSGWINITGGLFSLTKTYFGGFAAGTPLIGPSLQSTVTGTGLTSIVADWRYAIPNDPSEINNPKNPPGPTHPVLYVGGSSGVYRSTDQGQTWTPYPNVDDDGAAVDGGALPNVQVTDLDIVLGNVDPTTGHPLITKTSPDVLLATTFGRGDYAIRLAPQVVSESVQLDNTLPSPTGSQSGTESGLPKVSILQPVFDGMSEQSAFGNIVTVNLYDLTDPNNPVLVGVQTLDNTKFSVQTDQTGRFQIQVKPGYFKSDGTTDGVKTFGFQVTDATGLTGPMTKFSFVLDTTPIVEAASVQFAVGSDSGRSATDKITNIIRPTLIGQVIQAAPVTVQLVDVTNSNNPVVIGQGTTTASGAFSIQVNSGVYKNNGTTDGAKVIQVVALHVPNNSTGVLFSFTLDTTAPATPLAPSLLASSDTGFSNSDHVTNVATPTFGGTGESNAIVQLFANGNSVGSDQVSSTGNYTVTVASPLASNSYNMTINLVDVAGNVSQMSPIMAPPLVVQTGNPTIPTLKLDPAFDTGTVGDNITAAIPAQFDGTTDPGTSVIIKDNGLQIAAFLQPTGSNTFTQVLNLADGVHTLVVQVTNQAGNVSKSSTLVVTINSQALDADSKFIRAVYQEALNRPGTIAEWNFWRQFLVNGNGRATIANAIERSTEARTLTLNGWYQTFLGRPQAPQASEIQFWLTSFANGATEEQVLSSLLASAEYYNKAPKVPGVVGGPSPSDSAFVQALFIQLLNRKASSNDVNFFVSLLPNIGRQQLALTLLSSAEYRGDQVTIYYGSSLLGRNVPPSAGEVSGWVNSGLDLTSIRVDFLASAEFFFRVTGLQP